MEELFQVALKIAKNAHQGQKDKSGQPYLSHPIAVSEMGKTIQEKIVGILHDVVEDSEWTLEDLRNHGIPEELVRAVDCLSRRDGESVKDYMNRVKSDPLAIKVKLNDLTHNMDMSRISNPTEVDFKRLKKYEKQKKELEEILKGNES